MNKIKFYDIADYNSEDLYTLADFLRHSVVSISSYIFYSTWLKEGSGSILGNEYELTERGNKILLHQQEFLSGKEFPDENDPYVYTTTKTEMFEILDKWGQFMTQESDSEQILITQNEGGSVKFEEIT